MIDWTDEWKRYQGRIMINILLILLLLTTCVGVPHINNVDKGQTHEILDDFWLHVRKGTQEEITLACGKVVTGCHKYGDQIMQEIWWSIDRTVLDHEFNHPTYGPEHY